MIPIRLQEVVAEAAYDPQLDYPELIALLTALVEDVPRTPREQVLAFLEVNLPGAEVALLLEWPGEWFQNRWFEEAAFTPEELARHLLDRCGRELPGDPGADEDA